MGVSTSGWIADPNERWKCDQGNTYVKTKRPQSDSSQMANGGFQSDDELFMFLQISQTHSLIIYAFWVILFLHFLKYQWLNCCLQKKTYIEIHIQEVGQIRLTPSLKQRAFQTSATKHLAFLKLRGRAGQEARWKSLKLFQKQQSSDTSDSC